MDQDGQQEAVRRSHEEVRHGLEYGCQLYSALRMASATRGGRGQVAITVLAEADQNLRLILLHFRPSKGGVVFEKNSALYGQLRRWVERDGSTLAAGTTFLLGDLCLFARELPADLPAIHKDCYEILAALSDKTMSTH